MADSGLFIGFGVPVRGREKQAIAVFNEAMQFYAGLQQRGDIDSFEAVLLEPHGGDLGGFILLRGGRESLARVRATDDFDRLNTRAALVVEGFGVVEAAVGDRIGSLMALYSEQVSDLTQAPGLAGEAAARATKPFGRVCALRPAVSAWLRYVGNEVLCCVVEDERR